MHGMVHVLVGWWEDIGWWYSDSYIVIEIETEWQWQRQSDNDRVTWQRQSDRDSGRACDSDSWYTLMF